MNDQLALDWTRPGNAPPRARSCDTLSSHRAADEAERSGSIGRWTRLALDRVRARPVRTAAELAEGDERTAIRFRKRLPELEDRGLVHGVEDETGATDVRWYAGRDAEEARARARMERRAGGRR